MRERLARAAADAGRDPRSVTLLAVSKTHPAALVEQALAAGQRAFGENYVQEALEKMDALAGKFGEERARALQWHLIGPLQSNKTRLAATRFDWVQTLESEKIARRLSDRRPAQLQPLNVLIQVNVSGEASKSGIAAAEIVPLALAISKLPRLKLRGLMALPEPTQDTVLRRSGLRQVKDLFERLQKEFPGIDTLSIGMSDDMEAAIAEGSTMVRIGSAIFGARRRSRGNEVPPAGPVRDAA